MPRVGIKIVCFRKRYYQLSIIFPGEPQHWANDIAAQIPTDAAEYQLWLATQRKDFEKWEAWYEEYLSIKPGNEVTDDEPGRPENFIYKPSLLASTNDTCTGWVYTTDLDRETFSVNNGAHFKLDRVPHIDWVHSLAIGNLGDTISLPGAVPKEAVTRLAVEHTSEGAELSNAPGDLAVSDATAAVNEVVAPKDFTDIAWRQRRGPILRRFMFYLWSYANEDVLAASLLQWNIEDLLFREFAYAALCLAAGGKNVNIVSQENVWSTEVFGFIREGEKYDADSEFVKDFASGAHLQGSPRGSSPEATIYWLDDVLVVLAVQLYLPGALDGGIARVVTYCQEHHPVECIDAVLISVEHVILVHVDPGEKVQHTATMPLFDIENHLSLSASDRYAKSYLEKLATKKTMRKEAKRGKSAIQGRMPIEDEIGMDSSDSDVDEEDSDGEEESALCVTQVEGNVRSTFYALVQLFEATARKRIPPAKNMHLPYEIYTQIINHVTDVQTRESLMKVSRTFREICQENNFFTRCLMKPSDACLGYEGVEDSLQLFERYDNADGSQSQFTWEKAKVHFNAGFIFDIGLKEWRVAVGAEYGKKSFLNGERLRLKKL